MLLGREPHLLPIVRVPAVYLSSAFLAILAVLSARRMNNLRVSINLDGSIPTFTGLHERNCLAKTL